MTASGTRAFVRTRAMGYCEYCRMAQHELEAAIFHVEHIIARQHGGSDAPENLALACHHCNLHKGPNLTGIDPETGQIAALFHPRHERWDDHFVVEWPEIAGKTPTGRATVQVLCMNAPSRIELRIMLRMPMEA